MKDGGCSLTFAKVTNPNIIKVIAKSSCITNPPNYNVYTTQIGVQSRKLAKLTSSTLVEEEVVLILHIIAKVSFQTNNH